VKSAGYLFIGGRYVSGWHWQGIPKPDGGTYPIKLVRLGREERINEAVRGFSLSASTAKEYRKLSGTMDDRIKVPEARPDYRAQHSVG
jgi:hypothetical protein